jgi:hypothetical protein
MPGRKVRHHLFQRGDETISNCFRQQLVRLRVWLKIAQHRVHGVVRKQWQALRCRFHRVPVEVLLVDRARRRVMKRHLRAALRRLQGALGYSFPSDTAVIVQRIVVTDRQLAGCYQLGQRADGSRFTLIRLGLEIDDRSLRIDEIISVLAEQCIALAMQQGTGSLLVPIDLYPTQSKSLLHPTPLRPDPLATHAHRFDGRGA